MGLNVSSTLGQTPLDEDELDGLLIPGITTHQELDEFEHLNIEKAIRWSLIRKQNKEKILTESFIKQVHAKMYGEVWEWAGKFRQTNKNLGIPWTQIAVALKQLLGDTDHQITKKAFSPDEIAIRFKHRIVQIHCFPNGNGRHSRFMADIIISNIFRSEIFTWGSTNLIKAGTERSEYLKALKSADNGDISSLLHFARK